MSYDFKRRHEKLGYSQVPHQNKSIYNKICRMLYEVIMRDKVAHFSIDVPGTVWEHIR